MAVTTTLYSGNAQYYAGNIADCVNGGADYRTVGKNQTCDTYLFCNCNMSGLSSACRVSNVEVSFESRYVLKTDTAGTGNYNVKANLLMYYTMPSISGTEVNTSSGSKSAVFAAYAKEKVHSNYFYESYSFSGAPVNSSTGTIYGGGKGLVCAHFPLSHNGNLECHVWLKNVKFTVTRTRACYITFKGDGVTTKKTMYDYGASVSFGSTPTRTGYTFKGWSNGSATYTGTLPTAGEVDVTYTAVWEKTKYYLDLNGWINGGSSGNISQVGTADVYINGSLVSNDCTDYYVQHEVGTTYEIKDIKAKPGWKYDGVHSGSLKGTINAATTVVLAFSTDKIYKGNLNTNVYIGAPEADKVYLGTSKIYG
ncbi:MAG: InlB B-repeat-containing protein [Ruminococcus sp.]|nr:InlB B-repeat-containing protein [Ruminococcus sp.]